MEIPVDQQFLTYSDHGVRNKMTSHRVTLGTAHHLPVVEPLRGKHLVESPQGELSLLEDPGESAGCKAPEAPLQP